MKWKGDGKVEDCTQWWRKWYEGRDEDEGVGVSDLLVISSYLFEWWWCWLSGMFGFVFGISGLMILLVFWVWGLDTGLKLQGLYGLELECVWNRFLLCFVLEAVLNVTVQFVLSFVFFCLFLNCVKITCLYLFLKPKPVSFYLFFFSLSVQFKY